MVETEIRGGDVVSIERVSSNKVVVRALDEKQLISFEGKKYRVDKDKEPNTIKLTLLYILVSGSSSADDLSLEQNKGQGYWN